MKVLRQPCRILAGVLLLASTAATVALADQQNVRIYGYFATRLEKTWSEPSLDGPAIVKETAPGEWTNPYLNVMMRSEMDNHFRAFLNMNGSGGGEMSVRNFWGEYTASRQLNFRLGKSYRKFGIYNEILDAVPTYYGIEPPELFDADHLILSRTTTAMVYGATDFGRGVLNYSLSTDNGEGDVYSEAFPLGWDLNYRTGTGLLRVGTSGYSSFGPANSDVGVGDGSPKSGVLPWMAEDRFYVVGGDAELNMSSLTVQAAYWYSGHNAIRDPGKTVEMIEGGHPNEAQRARFLIDPAAPATDDNVNPDGDYTVRTAYVRAGYSLESHVGELGPYFQWDWYSNPETIQKKTYGGDNEAGASDDGQFTKWTLGVVYRPQPQVAIKLDGSSHRYTLGGQSVDYPEVRFDVSYIF